jgi:molecular chaperone DnaJ
VVRRNGRAGDLLVTVEVTVPDALTEQAREALETFAANTPAAPRDHLDARVRHD